MLYAKEFICKPLVPGFSLFLWRYLKQFEAEYFFNLKYPYLCDILCYNHNQTSLASHSNALSDKLIISVYKNWPMVTDFVLDGHI